MDPPPSYEISLGFTARPRPASPLSPGPGPESSTGSTDIQPMPQRPRRPSSPDLRIQTLIAQTPEFSPPSSPEGGSPERRPSLEEEAEAGPSGSGEASMAMRGGAPSPPSPPGAVQGPYPLWGTPPWILQDVAVYHHMAKHMIVEKITFEITDKCYKEAARQLEQEPPGCEQVCQEMAHRGAIEPPPPRHLKYVAPSSGWSERNIKNWTRTNALRTLEHEFAINGYIPGLPYIVDGFPVKGQIGMEVLRQHCSSFKERITNMVNVFFDGTEREARMAFVDPTHIRYGKKVSIVDTMFYMKLRHDLELALTAFLGTGYYEDNGVWYHWRTAVAPQEHFMAMRFSMPRGFATPDISGPLSVMGLGKYLEVPPVWGARAYHFAKAQRKAWGIVPPHQ